MYTNCLALAKLTINKKLNTYRLIVTFDTVNKITAKKAAYVSGDICDVNYENAKYEIDKTLSNAKAVLRTENIQFAN